jgi:Dullard-like phosphatase family protein
MNSQTTRTLLRSLQSTVHRTATLRFAVARAQSTWARADTKRSRTYSSGQWRVNGKQVAFHINDLKQKGEKHYSEKEEKKIPEIKPLRQYESDLVVVLDMDECLIHSQFLQGPGARYTHQVQRAGSLGHSSVEVFSIRLPDGEQVLVHERPHLHEFLARVSEKYETHIFTAAMEVYAKPVLKMLDPHNQIFTHCWYRESCQLDGNLGAYVKNLEPVWGQQLKRTVLVDNNPLSFLANPDNGILVSNFYNDPKDVTLPAVLDLLDELNDEEDVRPVLDARFGLKRALKDLGRGRPFARPQQQLDQQQDEEQQSQYVAAASN